MLGPWTNLNHCWLGPHTAVHATPQTMSYPGWNWHRFDTGERKAHLDAGDIVKFMCKAGTFTHDVTALDMSERRGR